MKQKVKFSSFSKIVTVAVLVLFVVGMVALIGDGGKMLRFCIIVGGTIVVGLYYCPISIEADKSEIRIRRLLSAPKVITYDTIQDVDTCYPSAGGLRLCGSGGFFGYWGYFSDIMIGSYFGYYGSRSNCTLVKLKDGKQYVIGCDNAVAMVDYIKSQI